MDTLTRAMRPLRNATFRTALAGGGWTLAGTTVGRLANVGSLLYVAARLGSEGFGGLSLALSTVLAVTSVSALGLPMAAVKIVAESRVNGHGAQDRLAKAALSLTVLGGAAAAGAVLMLAPYLARNVLGGLDIAGLLVLAAPLILLTPGVDIVAALLTGLERFRALGAYRAVHGLINGGLLAGVVMVRPSASTALAAIVAAEALVCALGWRLAFVAPKPPTLVAVADESRVSEVPLSGSRYLKREATVLLRVSVPALLGGASLQPALWVGQVLLSRRTGALQEVGLFAVAYRWHSMALFVPATLGGVLLPLLGRLRSERRHDDARGLLWRYGGLTLALAGLAAIGLIVLAGPVMRLQGTAYEAAVPTLIVLALAVIPAAANNVLSQMALAEDRIALWVWSDLALAAALAAVAFVLVPVLGSRGLAWAYFTGYLATCVVLLPVVAVPRLPR